MDIFRHMRKKHPEEWAMRQALVQGIAVATELNTPQTGEDTGFNITGGSHNGKETVTEIPEKKPDLPHADQETIYEGSHDGMEVRESPEKDLDTPQTGYAAVANIFEDMDKSLDSGCQSM